MTAQMDQLLEAKAEKLAELMQDRKDCIETIEDPKNEHLIPFVEFRISLIDAQIKTIIK